MNRSLVIAAVLSLAGAAQAQVWNEIGDAPVRPGSQMTIGVGPLVNINGTGGTDASGQIDVDFYTVRLVAGQTWTASTLGLASWDTMLALYSLDGANQLAFNDDFGSGLQSFISGTGDGNCYLLGITRFPDLGFDDTGSAGLFSYTIRLEGVEYCEVPAPGALALLGLGGAISFRRRR